MAYDGIQNGVRVTNFGESRVHAYVVDSVLNSTMLWSRFQGMGKQFLGPTMKFTLKITDSGAGQFYSGLETFSSAAVNTTLQLEYAQTAFEQPVVNIMLERFANHGANDEINLHRYKIDEAVAEMRSRLGAAIYGDGTSKQPNGLGSLVASTGTIGGQSRSTYSQLQSTVTASSGTLTLAKMDTLHDAITDTGEDETPTIGVTDFSTWSYFTQLLQPTVRASYEAVGYDKLPIRGKEVVRNADLRGGAGFTAVTYRGMPIIKDKAATAGSLYFLNENYLFWLGRTEVPSEYDKFLHKVSLGKPQTIEGQSAMPTASHGVFFQDMQMMPNQAGMVGRYHVIGQMAVTQPRRQGVLTGITGI